jgi:hypothetical protein
VINQTGTPLTAKQIAQDTLARIGQLGNQSENFTALLEAIKGLEKIYIIENVDHSD